MGPRLKTALITSLFVFFFSNTSLFAVCFQSTVSTFAGETEVNTCPGDGSPDIVRFKPNFWATAYRWVITDTDDVIVDWFSGSKYDFEPLGEGTSRVYGVSYSGLIDIPIGENIFEADFNAICSIISSNFVLVNRLIPDAGDVTLISGETIGYVCPDDGLPSILEFTNANATPGDYAYAIVDGESMVLGVSTDGTFDFEGLPYEDCFVYGIAYVGDLLVEVGQEIFSAELSNSCNDLSETYVTVIKESPIGGNIALSNGQEQVQVCVNDDNDDILEFFIQGSSNTPYAYLITDEDDNLIEIKTQNSHNFEGAPAGKCKVYGVAYTGDFIIEQGENLFTQFITNDCWDLSSNYIEVRRLIKDGGEVSLTTGGTEFFSCPDDGIADIAQFQNTSTSEAGYAYLITDTLGKILAIELFDEFDFDPAGVGICRVYGLSFVGDLLAEDGQSIFDAVLASDCFELSENYITVIRESPDGGNVSFEDGSLVAYTCPGDGTSDSLSFINTNSLGSDYTYIITDTSDVILASAPDGVFDFEGAPEGICRVWGLAFSGSETITVGDTVTMAALSDDCFRLSDNFIEVVRETPIGGLIQLSDGTDEAITCPGDGNGDVLQFEAVDASSGPYAYLITDINNIVIEIVTGNSFDFEGAPEGVCRVYGASYTGNITMQAGDDANVVPFSDDCFSYANNLINVIRVVPEAGSVETADGSETIEICSGDDASDVVELNSLDASAAPFVYVVTDTNDIIISTYESNEIDFEGAPTGICRIYGLSYTGNLIASQGDTLNINDPSDDCFDISDNYVELQRNYVNGGSVSTVDGLTQVLVCPFDGLENIVNFITDSDAAQSEYQYIITNNQDEIVAIPDNDLFDFEPAGIGICKVWGLSFTGNFIGEIGDNVLLDPMGDGCFNLSDNSILIIRDIPLGDQIVSSLGDEFNICVGDGNPDEVLFLSGSFSFANYIYLIADENNNLIDISFDDTYDFDASPEGTCTVWGMSYTGNLLASEGMNIFDDELADDCYDLSENSITINKESVDGGSIFTPSNNNPIYTCPGDGNFDFIGFFNSSSSSANYRYVITDTSNVVLEIVPFNLFNFEDSDEGICYVYGVSFTGSLELDEGDDLLNFAISDGCYEISDNFLTIIKVNPEGGFVSTIDGDTQIEIEIDGVPDSIQFVNSASPLAKFRYVITDENDVIQAIIEEDIFDFEPAGVGICRVYGLAYTGTLLAEVGDTLGEADPTTGCWELSINFITVTRIEMGANDFGNDSPINEYESFHQQLTVSPNPFGNIINLNLALEQKELTQISIADISGKVVFTQVENTFEGLNTIRLDLSNLDNGWYVISVVTEENVLIKRVLKN